MWAYNPIRWSDRSSWLTQKMRGEIEAVYCKEISAIYSTREQKVGTSRWQCNNKRKDKSICEHMWRKGKVHIWRKGKNPYVKERERTIREHMEENRKRRYRSKKEDDRNHPLTDNNKKSYMRIFYRRTY